MVLKKERNKVHLEEEEIESSCATIDLKSNDEKGKKREKKILSQREREKKKYFHTERERNAFTQRERGRENSHL